MQSTFLKAVGTLMSATVIGQLLMVLATPLLTRLYTPDEFGIFAVFVTISSTMLVIAALRYEFALALPKRDAHAQLLHCAVLWINAIAAVAILLICIVFSRMIAVGLGLSDMAALLFLVPVFVVFAGGYRAFNYLAIRYGAYSMIAQTKVFQASASIVVQLLGGVAGFGVWGLAVGFVVGQAVGLSRLRRVTRKYLLRPYAQLRQQRTWVLLKKYKKFPQYDAPAAMINTLSVELPNVLLAILFSPAVAGFFMLSQRVLSIPISLIGQAVGQVLIGFANEAIEDQSIHQLLKRIIFSLVIIILIPALALFFFAEPIFSLVFGDKWLTAGTYSSWLILGISVQFVYSPVSMMLAVTDGQHLNLLIHTLQLTGKIVFIFASYMMNDPLISIVGVSIVAAIGYLLGIFLIISHVKRSINKKVHVR